MTKFASLKKNRHKNCCHEKKSGVKRSGISLLFSKNMPLLLRVYIGPFIDLYHTFLISPRSEINETVNF